MSDYLKLSKKDIMRIRSEADEDENGIIEYKGKNHHFLTIFKVRY